MNIKDESEIPKIHIRVYHYKKYNWALIGAKCAICGKFFQQKNSLISHDQRHKERQEYVPWHGYTLNK